MNDLKMKLSSSKYKCSPTGVQSWEHRVVGGDVWEGFLEKVASELGQLALLRDLSIAAPQLGVKVKVSGRGWGSRQYSTWLTNKNSCKLGSNLSSRHTANNYIWETFLDANE